MYLVTYKEENLKCRVTVLTGQLEKKSRVKTLKKKGGYPRLT